MSNSVTMSQMEAAARVLRQARSDVHACDPVSVTHGIDATAAYQVQEINTQAGLARGRRLVGRKIGLTSIAVQEQLGVSEPDMGMLFADMEVKDGGVVDCSELIQPKAEGEIAFVVGRDIDQPDITMGELQAAIEFALPAIEIVDSAIRDWRITLADTVADNASSALYVLGSQATRLSALDLRLEGMLMHKNHMLASSGVGAACLGNPLNACLWLARTMASQGRGLKAGDVILSGALGPMTPVGAGDHLQMSLTRLGGVSCRFV